MSDAATDQLHEVLHDAYEATGFRQERETLERSRKRHEVRNAIVALLEDMHPENSLSEPPPERECPSPHDAQAGPAATLAALSQWIDQHPANAARDREAALWGRVAKITEEAGEVIAALIGVTGQNPRKGVTHGEGEVVRELLDVAVTALGAVEHCTGNLGESWRLLEEHVDAVGRRVLDGDTPGGAS